MIPVLVLSLALRQTPAPAKPCADPTWLCRISPWFCPGAYPPELQPCWPRHPIPVRPRG